MTYTIREIQQTLQAEPTQLVTNDRIESLATDSRSLRYPSRTLFFAIHSRTGDGHLYLKDCYEKRVRNFIVEKGAGFPGLPPDCNILTVPSSIEALQFLAAQHRKKFTIPVIGITGSNGKTIVKEWLYQLLDADYRIARSPKSYNSQIGVPLSVWQLNPTHQLGIFEAGISQPGEMEKLEKIIRPDIGIFTNIGAAHQVNFSSRQEKIREKLKLFRNSKVLIYCRDHISIHNEIKIAESTGYLPELIELISWGYHEDATIRILQSESFPECTSISLKVDGERKIVTIPFTDLASVENLMHCYSMMHYLGYKHEIINDRIAHLQPVEMRLEIKAGINNCTIINDSYNSDPVSLSIALDVLAQQNQHERKILILSDILESGGNERELYKEIAEIIKQQNISRFIGIGSALMCNKDLLPEHSIFFNTTQEFINTIKNEDFREEAILLKGSRVFGFERIARRLQQKAHTTVLEINLNSLIHNLTTYKSFLKPGVKVMAMVKASSYGSGSYEIANALQFHKTDYLAVAYADEGVYLRQHGITLPVMVMNPEENAFESIISNDLEPEIYSFRLLQQYIEYIKANGGTNKDYPIHLKIDTGMHRLGFMSEEMPLLIQILQENTFLKVTSSFTHLASTDVPEHDDFTRKQLSIFREAVAEIEQALPYPFLKHALNSAGITRFPEAQFDMVRLGIGLYGIDPTREIQEQLEPASSLKTHISQIKHIKPGESVGYSRKGIVHKETDIATIGIGYADGFPRALGNGTGKVMVNGFEASLIGNVCMDMCMIDITGIPAEEGDEVILFDKDYPVELMAERIGTIPYEVLTNISQRVKRVYYRE